MSLVRPILNLWLRVTEKRYLARETDVHALRRSFATKARLFFLAPRGTRSRPGALNGVPVLWVNDAPEGPLILYLHGGAYVMGSPQTHRALAGWLSRAARLPVCLPDYRLAPEHPFPAALEDALAAYRAVMDRPGGVVIGGDSAGGGLALALLSRLLRDGLPRPLGLFALSPVTDMSFSGESVTANAKADVVLPASRIHDMAALYLPEGVAPRDPGVSPLWADFTGAPPVWLTAGDTEFLRDDTRRMAERLRAQGVPVMERIERDLPHVWPLFHTLLPEARRTLRALGRWINSLSTTTAGS
ncbi:alpha/beta hydrolase [Maliponia aquimaris]|uniref:Monoterpene epsilon-lactone hydrolase n=1 Tax=Maliponia aquimaris TaxID=1673631 RepID=A0A238K7T4_9RHOB|nr:alpha/beta hydrolase [Maliponia aquimaris]SMX38960.1 Monoterpene epsilon-lactone hydrolase [Maliponia aquimaris]